MKKSLLSLFIGLVCSISTAMADVTFTVNVPEGTQHCYVVGALPELSSWAAGSGVAMTKVNGQNQFVVTVAGITAEDISASDGYKYVCGPDWKYVEVKTASKFAEQVVYGLITNKHHFESDMPIEKVKGAISLFHLICDDGNMGCYHGDLTKLYLYLSRLEWERGYHDDAFVSLDSALHHAKALEALCDGNTHCFTSPLVSHVEYETKPCDSITKSLPNDWPFWCNPDYSKAKEEITADPRWDEWVKKCKA